MTLEIDVLTNLKKDGLDDFAKELGVSAKYIFDGSVMQTDLSYMSKGVNFLLHSPLEGDFIMKVDITLFDKNWTDLNAFLLENSKVESAFASERYDRSEQAPWDYYLYENGRRYDVEVLDGIELGMDRPEYLVIHKR